MLNDIPSLEKDQSRKVFQCPSRHVRNRLVIFRMNLEMTQRVRVESIEAEADNKKFNLELD